MTSREIERRRLFRELWIEAASRTGSGILCATGPCMAPSLSSGRRVLVEMLPPGRCTVGDVVVYRGARWLTAHRVVGRFRGLNGWHVVHKGDSSRWPALLRADQVLGRVVATYSTDGTLLQVDGAPPPLIRQVWHTVSAVVHHLGQRILHR